MAYGLVATWLRSEVITARLGHLDTADLSELARLLPELLADVPGLVGPEPLPESEQRHRLFRAIVQGILVAGSPLLLVADDLQWCDAESLRFVHYLLRAAPEQRLLIAATARREEISARHPVSRLVTALEARERVTEIRLERLSREETGLLAERTTSTALAEADADRLYEDSEGNPLFIVEALRAEPAAAESPGTSRSKV